MGCGPAERPRSPDLGALPDGIRGIQSDETVVQPRDCIDAVEDPLSYPAPRERQAKLSLRRTDRVSGAGDGELAVQAGGHLAPGQGCEVQTGETQQQIFGSPPGRPQRGDPVRLDGSDLARESGIDRQPLQRALSPEMPPHFSSGLHRREGAPNALKRKWIHRDIRRHAQDGKAGIEVNGSLDLTGRKVPVLMLRDAIKGDVPERAIQWADAGQASWNDDCRRQDDDRSKLAVGLPDSKLGKGEP